MNIQDKLERILRELHIMVSRAKVSKGDGNYVLVHKREMQKQLGNLSQVVTEMMEQYEVTTEGRNRAELVADKQRMEIIRDANHQAQDIYAASVIYTDDALGRIQDIITTAEQSARETMHRLTREMEEEKRLIRSNQLELLTQLEDMKDTAKYLRLIEERNREIAKAKAKKKEEPQEKRKRKQGASRQKPKETGKEAQEALPEIPEEAVQKEIEALVQEVRADETAQEADEKIVYEKPVIKINKEYFARAGISLDEEAQAQTPAQEDAVESTKEAGKKERRQTFFPFGRKS